MRFILGTLGAVLLLLVTPPLHKLTVFRYNVDAGKTRKIEMKVYWSVGCGTELKKAGFNIEQAKVVTELVKSQPVFLM